MAQKDRFASLRKELVDLEAQHATTVTRVNEAQQIWRTLSDQAIAQVRQIKSLKRAMHILEGSTKEPESAPEE